MLVNLFPLLEVKYAVILFFLPFSSCTCKMRERNTVKWCSHGGAGQEGESIRWYLHLGADVITWVAFDPKGCDLVPGFSGWFGAPEADWSCMCGRERFHVWISVLKRCWHRAQNSKQDEISIRSSGCFPKILLAWCLMHERVWKILGLKLLVWNILSVFSLILLKVSIYGF